MEKNTFQNADPHAGRYLSVLKLVACVIWISVHVFGQIPDTLWSKKYGGADYDYGSSLEITSDGGFIIVGFTHSYGSGYMDAYLIKTDQNGDTIWTRTHGSDIYEDGRSVKPMPDGGYALAGTAMTADTSYIYMLRTDASGDTVWCGSYGMVTYPSVYEMITTFDSGFIMVGTCLDTFGQNGNDVLLIKTDSRGDTAWTRTFGSAHDDYGYSIRQTPDSGYIIAGSTDPTGEFISDIYLIKTDAGGNLQWSKTHGGPLWEEGYSIALTSDHGYIITGQTVSFGAGASDVYVVRTDSIGDTLWTAAYGGVYTDCGIEVIQINDGGFFVVGYRYYIDSDSTHILLLRSDSSGNLLGERTYGDSLWSSGQALRQTADGGLVIIGGSPVGDTEPNVYLLKTSPVQWIMDERIFGSSLRLLIYPNPFISYAGISGYEKEYFSVSDVTGRIVGKYKGQRIGENLPAGVYFVISQNKNIHPLRIVKIR